MIIIVSHSFNYLCIYANKNVYASMDFRLDGCQHLSVVYMSMS